MVWKSPSADRIVAARSLAEQSLLACGTGAGVAANLSRGFRTRSFQVMFFSFRVVAVLCKLSAARLLCALALVRRGICSAATYCDAMLLRF